MDSYFSQLFTSLGKKYEVLVYERSRRASLQAQRNVLNLPVQEEPDYRLEQDIQLTERLLAVLAANRLSNEIKRP